MNLKNILVKNNTVDKNRIRTVYSRNKLLLNTLMIHYEGY